MRASCGSSVVTVRLTERRLPAATRIAPSPSDNDYPAAARGRDGTVWVAYVAYQRGVEPDIVVDNDPAKEFAGTDQQLDRAIEEVMAELRTANPTLPLPPHPPWPDKHSIRN